MSNKDDLAIASIKRRLARILKDTPVESYYQYLKAYPRFTEQKVTPRHVIVFHGLAWASISTKGVSTYGTVLTPPKEDELE